MADVKTEVPRIVHNDGWKLSVAFLLGLGIGAGVLWFSYRFNDASVDEGVLVPDTKQQVAPGTTTSAGSSPSAIAVAAQFAGTSVFVQSVTLPQDGWVVVYENNLGQPGNALGARRLDAGTHEKVTVPLLRSTSAGFIYHVVLHYDDGDRVFSLADDFPVRDTNNAPIIAQFSTYTGN